MGTIHGLLALLLAGHYSASANTISPTSYNLNIYLDTNNDIFSGTAEILANVVKGGETKITLHSHGLNTSIIRVNQAGTEMYDSVKFDSNMQTMEITTRTGLETNAPVRITITYQGKVSTDGTGLYSFTEKDGNKVYMTNFYPIYARKFFPCLDEPGSSAAIALTVTTSSSNGKFLASVDVAQSKAKNGDPIYELAMTPSIAPYSLFFTMGDWSNSYSLPVENVTLWLPSSLKNTPDLIDQNLLKAISLPNITMVMSFMKTKLNIFITPVLDGESYSGLNTIVLKKDIVIDDLVETPTEDQKHNLIKISYALYKMFFGTVVRPANWGDNWLSNSLSTYMAYHAFDNITTYGSSDSVLVTDLDERVFRTTWAEGSPTPYPTNSPTAPKDILAFINGPAMDKGAFAIKTLETLFNKQQDSSIVINGLMNFLISNAWKAVDTSLFINSMANLIQVNATGVSVQDILKPMISRSGYPLISLNRFDLTMTLSRANFIYNSLIAEPQSAAQPSKLTSASDWLVPITSTTSKDPSTTQFSIYYYSPNATTPLFLNGSYDQNAWALLNVDGKGMLRVDYDNQSWAVFKTEATKKFNPASRAKLVTDAFASAESGVQSWATTLDFLEYLDQETDLAPWTVALQGFKRMWTWVYPTGTNTKDPKQINLSTPFQAYMSKRLENLYKLLGTSGPNGDPKDPLRRYIIGAACEYGNSSCVNDLAAQYQSMESQSTTPTNDMYSVVVCNGLKGVNSVNDWRSAYQKYVKSGKWFNQRLIDSHYSFLACPKNTDVIDEFLRKILLTDPVLSFPVNQVTPAMKAIIDKPQHVDQALNFFITNQAQFNITVAHQVELMQALGDRLTVPSQYALLQAFSKNASLDPALVIAVNASVLKAQQNINFIYSVQDDVLAGLTGNTPPTPPSPVTSTSTSPTSPTGSEPTSTTPTPPTTAKPDSATSVTVSVVTIALSVIILAFTQ